MKISRQKLWTYLVAILCVVPTYANIGPISIQNILLVLFYICTIHWYGISKGKLKYAFCAIPAFTLFWIVWLVQSTADSGFATAGMQIFHFVAFWATVAAVLKTEEQVDQLIHSLISITFWLCLLGILEEFTHVNIFSQWLGGGSIYSEERMGMNRIYSTFTHPISYGIFLSMIAVLTLYMINKYKDKRLYFNFALILINLCFTISRSPIVVGIISVILMMIISGMVKFNKITRKRFAIFLGIVVLLVVSPLLFPSILNFFSQMFRSVAAVFDSNVKADMGSAEGDRKKLYAWTMELLRGHYIFGKGTKAVFRYVIASRPWGDLVKVSVENQYLYVLFLHGIVGLVTYLLSLINIVIFFIKGLFKRYNDTMMKAGFVIVFLYLIMFFSTAESSENTMWYTVLAMGIATKRIRDTKIRNMRQGEAT